MTRHLNFSVLILGFSAGISTLLSAPPVGAPYISLLTLDLSPVSGVKIGFDQTGRIIAIVMDDDGQIAEIGLATFDQNDNLIFGRAELIEDGGLQLQMSKVGGAMMIDNNALSFDPRLVAVNLAETGLGHVHRDLVARIEGTELGAELVFGPVGVIGTGSTINATVLTMVGKTFLIAVAGDIALSIPVRNVGRTWVANGDIGHILPDGHITSVDIRQLAAFGIGVPAKRARMQTGHDAQMVAA